jgi:hypothetical protein
VLPGSWLRSSRRSSAGAPIASHAPPRWRFRSPTLLSDDTRRALGEGFALRDLGEVEVRGVAAPLHVFAPPMTAGDEIERSLVYGGAMTSHDEPAAPAAPAPGKSPKQPPKLFECKLCGKVFDSDDTHPACAECDSNDVEQVG